MPSAARYRASKLKPAPPPGVPAELAAMADELGALEKEMAPHAQKLARIDLLKKQIRAACPVSPDKQWTLTGNRFLVMLNPCAMERSIDILKLVRLVGAKAFATFATCTLKALEAANPPAVIAAVVTTEQTGSRSLKTFEKGAVPLTEAA